MLKYVFYIAVINHSQRIIIRDDRKDMKGCIAVYPRHMIDSITEYNFKDKRTKTYTLDEFLET